MNETMPSGLLHDETMLEMLAEDENRQEREDAIRAYLEKMGMRGDKGWVSILMTGDVR